MQKLDRTGNVTSIPGVLFPPVGNAPVLTPAAPVVGVSPLLLAPTLVPPVVPAAAEPVDNVAIPTKCLLIQNLFDPTVETDPDFDLDIKEDVETECAKHGTVKHIFVDKNSAGNVYVHFNSTSSAMSAQKALHGRWFAGHSITAMFLTYEARFPSSSRLLI